MPGTLVFVLLIAILVALLTGSSADEQGPSPEPQLRQTGVASGYLDDVPRAGLCERAETSAWDLVWRSCDDEHELDNVSTGSCATVDYTPAKNDGRGPFMEVRVQVEYDCKGP